MKKKTMEILSVGGVDLAVDILREWYGQRPVVILADEVGKSEDEAVVRRELCGAMDSWGSQVYVAMSALSKYQDVVNMFKESNRRVDILVLPPLGSDAFELFSSKLSELDAGETKKNILRYRIGLAWGATGGYARAIEIFVEYIREKGFGAGMVMEAIENFQIQMGLPLPPKFTPDELESLADVGAKRSFQETDQGTGEIPEATYRGSVLVDTVKINDSMFYLPTVAPWHVAELFRENELQMRTRCDRLMEVIGRAYKEKAEAIEGNDWDRMRAASSYLTEVTAAWGLALAMVKNDKKNEKLPAF